MAIRDDLPTALGPWITDDLQVFAEEIGGMFAEVESFTQVEDAEDNAWRNLLDPDLTPAIALPWLAQFVGETIPVGLEEGPTRERIRDHANQRRGTLESIFRAAQRTLTGSRTVSIIERDIAGGGGDDPDRITVHTYTNETPDSAQVAKDLRDVVPADIILNYTVLGGQTWQNLKSANATWTVAKATYPTWTEAKTTVSGTNSWSRERPWV